jgi:hypothetical protein
MKTITEICPAKHGILLFFLPWLQKPQSSGMENPSLKGLVNDELERKEVVVAYPEFFLKELRKSKKNFRHGCRSSNQNF